MRKFLIGILLAGAAASPALAQQDNERRPVWDTNRSDSRPERPAPRENRGERSNAERPQQVRQAPQFEARQQDSNRGSFDRSRWQGGDRAQQVEQARRNGGWSGERGNWQGRNRDDGARQQPSPQQVEQARRGGSWSGERSSWTGDRSNWQGRRDGDYRRQQYQGSRWASGGWNRDWRNDRRYDWRSYRDRHRSVFRLGVYFDPFGYGYRQFNIGYRLQPVYFGQRYWIDPAMYQLPYPPPGTQWVRYWNDALLVDMYSGEVVDVIYNFFW